MPRRDCIAALLFALVAPLASAENASSTVTFGDLPARIGDRVEQDIRMQLRLKATVRRGAEVLDESESETTRAHTRSVTTTDVADGRRIAVTVAYGEATEKPVANKTYNCRRVGDALRITDPQGAIPSLAEFEIVSRHMHMLGKPNPLADFLIGKTLTVGESINLPTKVATALFGSKRFGDVEQFRLTLAKVTDTKGALAAKFTADIHVAAADGTQTRMEIGGPMVIEAATCRVLSTELLGPIAMNQSRHDPGGLLQVSAVGRFTVTMQSQYRDSLLAKVKPGLFR